ncbi:MAG: radical SAM protein, partial [Proteobacteria bacterium]|nr:radical SAM protein [Pseudomonadota bacterium]
LRCIMCSVWRAGERGNNPDFYNELSTDRIFSLLGELKKLGTKRLHFSGGEPLLRKDLFEIMIHAKELDMSLVINTNGTLISRRIAEKLVDSGVQEVIISIDSANPEIHDEIRGRKGAWRKAIEGMTNLDIVRKELDSPLKIRINSLLMSLNYKTVDEIMDLKGIVDFD